MKVAIVGSRDYSRLDLVVDYVKALPRDTVVVSGGARGVDRMAAVAAYNAGLPVCEYRPDWSLGRQAGLERNTLIVEQSDRVVAFWDGQSRGMLDTVRKAALARKDVVVFGPEGIPVGVLGDGTIATEAGG